MKVGDLVTTPYLETGVVLSEPICPCRDSYQRESVYHKEGRCHLTKVHVSGVGINSYITEELELVNESR